VPSPKVSGLILLSYGHQDLPSVLDFTDTGIAAHFYPARKHAMKVLVVEDNLLHAEMLSGIVASWAHAVKSVAGGFSPSPSTALYPT
jgi:hypothetical protein